MHVVTSSQTFETSLNMYPAMHVTHFVESVLEQVAQGRTQLAAHVKVDVRKNPSVQALHPPIVQVLQFVEHALHVVPER
jgi:hypothetical protein